MDNASDYGSEDSRFESWQGRNTFSPFFKNDCVILLEINISTDMVPTNHAITMIQVFFVETLQRTYKEISEYDQNKNTLIESFNKSMRRC